MKKDANMNKILSIDPVAAVTAMNEFQDYSHIMAWHMQHQNDAEGMFPDTFGCECFFLEDMVEDELADDITEIIHAYLKHRPEALTEVESTTFASEDPEDNTACRALEHIFLNIMYTDAKRGNAYAKELFKNLYQTYYRKEYQQLKRFRTITAGEALAVAGLDVNNPDNRFYIYNLARILTMCPILGIEVHSDCAFLYHKLNDLHEKWKERRVSETDFPEFDKDVYQDCKTQVAQWFDAVRTPLYEADELEVYRESQEILEQMLLHDYFEPDAAPMNRYDDMGMRHDFVQILYVLRMTWPKREFSFEDVQKWTSLYECEQAFTQSAGQVSEFLRACFRGDRFGTYFFEPTGRFRPEKIRVQGKSDLQKNRQPDAVETVRRTTDADEAAQRNEVLLAELESLRGKVRQQKKEAEAAHNHTRELQRELERIRSDIQRYEDERAELIALREHVYRSTEEDIPAAEEDLAAMEEAIRRKRIVIIGGHDNWTKKLKNRFPDWIFFSPTVSGTWNDKILLGVDYTFFFTDTISHSTYNKFLNVIRERKLPFGYIAEINLEKNIRQIYREVCGD